MRVFLCACEKLQAGAVPVFGDCYVSEKFQQNDLLREEQTGQMTLKVHALQTGAQEEQGLE